MRTANGVLLASLLFITLLSRDAALGQPSEPEPYSWIQEKHARPFVEVAYGLDWLRHKLLGIDLGSLGAFEIRAGLRHVDTLHSGVLFEREGSVLGSWYSRSPGGSGGTTGITGRLARFGFGNSQGYGYDLNGSAIVPYIRLKSSLTRLSTEQTVSIAKPDSEILSRYEGAYRFGLSAESGVRLNFGPDLSLSGAYEVSVVYPRLVFWRWLGSSAIAGAANGIVSLIGRKILDISPVAGPIVIFVLKSAVAWTTYQLWRTDMNWPFPSETPLTHETLGFGLGYSF